MLDLALLAATIGAAARTTRLATADTITHPLRSAILTRIAQNRTNRRAIARGEDVDPPTGARAWLLELATCHWCMGFWITAAAVALAYTTGHTLAYQATVTILAASYLVGWLADNERD